MRWPLSIMLVLLFSILGSFHFTTSSSFGMQEKQNNLQTKIKWLHPLLSPSPTTSLMMLLKKDYQLVLRTIIPLTIHLLSSTPNYDRLDCIVYPIDRCLIYIIHDCVTAWNDAICMKLLGWLIHHRDLVFILHYGSVPWLWDRAWQLYEHLQLGVLLFVLKVQHDAQTRPW